MKSINSQFWEEDLAFILEELIEKARSINYNDSVEKYHQTEDLAKEYAHMINLWSIDGYGDIYSFDDFSDCVECGGFIDYDGQGIFIDNNTGERLKAVRCNVDWLKKNKPENSDYIMWFNR